MLPIPHRGPRPLSRRRRTRPLEQLSFELGPERPRWVYSRLVSGSVHFRRIRERTEFARYFFPELDGVTIRLGLALKRGVLGWGSLDPEAPGIWVRPRRLEYFTIAHELTHLLQARKMVPRGERQCDLWALARSPMLIDTAPSYLKVPRSMRGRTISTAQATALCEAARRAIAAREAGDRRYLKRFENELRSVPGALHAAAAVADPPRAVANLFARLRRTLSGGGRP